MKPRHCMVQENSHIPSSLVEPCKKVQCIITCFKNFSQEFGQNSTNICHFQFLWDDFGCPEASTSKLCISENSAVSSKRAGWGLSHAISHPTKPCFETHQTACCHKKRNHDKPLSYDDNIYDYLTDRAHNWWREKPIFQCYEKVQVNIALSKGTHKRLDLFFDVTNSIGVHSLAMVTN